MRPALLSRLRRLMTARLRLTLMYSALFLASGTFVLALVYIVASRGAPLRFGSSAGVAVAVPTPASGLPAVARVVRDPVAQQHAADAGRLLEVSWLALAITTAASAFLGWLAAGRVLRPLRSITSTARTISAGNLHRRLALAGPDDEFKQLGDTLDDLLGRLQGSFDAQRRFVANASHELRTPLTVERTLLQVALADPEADAVALRATCEELLVSNSEHERLLESLLTLATSERGLDQREELDLASLAERAVSARAADRYGLRVETELAPARTTGDAALVERLIANLVDNALSHNVAHGNVRVVTSADASSAVLTVENTGPPIRPGEIERLFEPFQRGDETRASERNGHFGLGLSIVRAIAKAHAATVEATPRSGGGLIVTVRFA